ncbi:hypothetical protein OGAPHI_003776 [Ogataea philodendri]|uniref:cAMP-independent regulatory protein pac2 n=1 Tax=Ogataea philodendri TaxID=1378263 RepID=A0A9P8P5Y6_9ASCO|nr:uncharacterized protein OGAPHI_003776 [Ogataea philodendri]KAH3665589.1 hypothetical protein OGAPHI_003776 [Ogataea philodendri]
MESYHGVVLSLSDAILLLEAARNNLIPKINRRLSDYERMVLIRPGSIFVWNESESKIKRWTDSRNWSASRVNSAFLIYREMESGENGHPSSNVKPDGLVKQSFSATLKSGDKYHIISYMPSSSNVSELLKRPTNDPRLQGLKIEESLYSDYLAGEVESETSTRVELPEPQLENYNSGPPKPKTLAVQLTGFMSEPNFAPAGIQFSDTTGARYSGAGFKYNGRLQEDGNMLSILDRGFI